MGRRELESNLPLPGLIAKERAEARTSQTSQTGAAEKRTLYLSLNLGASGRILRMRRTGKYNPARLDWQLATV